MSSGWWEIQQQQSVLVCILHTEVTTIAWSLGLRNLQIPGGILPVSGMPFDMSRNVCCQKAIECGAKWLFFLDSDVVPPNDAILRLMSRGKPFISGVYCRRSPPHGVPVMIKNGVWLTQFPLNSIIEVDYVGAGCMLIRRDVLENCPPQRPGKRWFDWRVDMQGLLPQDQCLSEDFNFCTHIKRTMKIPTFVDTSIICRHVGFAQFTYNNVQPLEATPVT